MIKRIEFYTVICVLAGILLFAIYYPGNMQTEKVIVPSSDSIYQAQRDSALSLALKYELKNDSLQAVINRRNLDIKTIRKKYENEKKNVLLLSADSTLRFFERTVTTP